MSNPIVRAAVLSLALLSGGLLAQGIPGIDPMPRAEERRPQPAQPSSEQPAAGPAQQEPSNPQQPATGPAQQPTANSEKPAEQAPAGRLDSELPLIRNLRVERVDDPGYSVRLSWDVSPHNDTAIYVVRYIRPTATRELVMDADSVAYPLLGPQETTFLDRGLPDGAYYYAVVTVYEATRSQGMNLVADGNYSTKPMIVYRSASPAQPGSAADQNARLQVRALSAVNAQSSVKLNWSAPANSNVSYNVYRSFEPMANPMALRVARRIGQTQANQLQFEDTTPPLGRVVYYGVTVNDPQTGEEGRELSFGQSYIQNVFQPVQVSQDRSRLLPDALTAYLENRDTVKLLWADPDGPVSSLRIYRSTRPISNAQELARATALGEVGRGVNSYRDRSLAPGVYYYALVPRDSSAQDVQAFVEGRTFTGFGSRILGGQSPGTVVENQQKPQQNDVRPDSQHPDPATQNTTRPYLSELRARVDGDSVQLSWRVVGRERARNVRLLLYRSDRSLRSWGDVRSHGDLLAELEADTQSYTDAGLPHGRYFYVLSLEADGHAEDRLLAGRNFVGSALAVGGGRPESDQQETASDLEEGSLAPGMVGLSRILQETYYRRSYGEAVRRIAPYVLGRGVDDSVKARAMLFTGMSYFHMGQFRSAMEFFLHERVRRQYPERARFWYNRSLERAR
ncbi:MAG: hypothetical protein K1X75_04485 [Leptospirales bacterium]|nr:hypothetical protein [Leptospirales bacterium]